MAQVRYTAVVADDDRATGATDGRAVVVLGVAPTPEAALREAGTPDADTYPCTEALLDEWLVVAPLDRLPAALSRGLVRSTVEERDATPCGCAGEWWRSAGYCDRCGWEARVFDRAIARGELEAVDAYCPDCGGLHEGEPQQVCVDCERKATEEAGK